MFPPVSGVSPVSPCPNELSSVIANRNVSGPVPGLEPGSPLSHARTPNECSCQSPFACFARTVPKNVTQVPSSEALLNDTL